jgi:diguanylate cyclase (GGDEF)-like protein
MRRGIPHTATAGDELTLTCEVHPISSGTLSCLPLMSRGEPIGVIHLERAGGFDDEAIRTAMRLAEQLALALSNLRLMRKMEAQAMTDPLTGLANARFFDPLLERSLSAAERDHTSVGLLALDLDHFKTFNDRFGHPAGDEALRTFARTLRANLRASDTAARMGGEEFEVALHDTDLAGAATVAEKIRAAVEQSPVEIAPGRFEHVTVSIGVAASATHGSDRLTLMKVADQALYSSKGGGRNRVHVANRTAARRATGMPALEPTPMPRRQARTIRRPAARPATRPA